MKTLIFVPTYNERENVGLLYSQIRNLGLDCDILFMDDNSPDGTGDVLDELKASDSRLYVTHRIGKLGIGSAHREGILWAYERGYQILLTMDADFTHSPQNIPALLEAANRADVVVASRYLMPNSLEGWALYRKALTQLGHILTDVCLGVPQDATGAFRVYRLDRIPKRFLDRVESNGYAFFFESLFILNRNHFSIFEVPNALPPRTYGHSKMTLREILKSVQQLRKLFFRRLFARESIAIGEA
jgi:dolichol-phosphate mannosyltransferase